jgi:predicted phosphoribosyltransferase
MGRFRDRHHAGRVLAPALEKFGALSRLVVLALPRGGVPVGYEVARSLGAPLDVMVVRKLGVPGREELAMGALASGGALVFNEDIVFGLGIPEEVVGRIVSTQRLELARREELYRGDRPPLDVGGRTVILVDDGLATGATMRAAVEGLRQLGPAHIIVGIPIASAATCEELRPEVDDLVVTATPEPFDSVGLWYEDFSPTTDEEVRDLLERAELELHGRADAWSPAEGP